MHNTHTFVGRYVHPQTHKEYEYEASYYGKDRISWSVKIRTNFCFHFVNSGVIYGNKLTGKSLNEMVRMVVEESIEEMPPPWQNFQISRPSVYA